MDWACVVFGTAAVAIADSRYGALGLDKSQLVFQQTSCGNARNDGSMLDDSSIWSRDHSHRSGFRTVRTPSFVEKLPS